MAWGDGENLRSVGDDYELDIRPHVLIQASCSHFYSPSTAVALHSPFLIFLPLPFSALCCCYPLPLRNKIYSLTFSFTGEFYLLSPRVFLLAPGLPLGALGVDRCFPRILLRVCGFPLSGALAPVGSGSFSHGSWDETVSEANPGTALPGTG